MKLQLPLFIIGCFLVVIGCGHRGLAVVNISKAATTAPITPPIYADTPHRIQVLQPKPTHLNNYNELTDRERVRLANVNLHPESKDTTIRKLSNALVDQMYWSHGVRIKKDSSITVLTDKVDRLTKIVIQNHKDDQNKKQIQQIAAATYDMFHNLGNWSLFLIFIFVSTHFALWAYQTYSKKRTVI